MHQLQASVGTVTYQQNGQFESFTVSAPISYVCVLLLSPFIAWNLLLVILAVVAIAKVVRVTSHVKRKIFCLLIVFLFRTTKALLLAQVTHMLQFLGPLKLDGTSRLARRGLSPFCPMALCELVPAQLYFHSAVRYHKYR